MAAMESPCVKICVLDVARGICRGCGRTLDEIERWTRMSAAERKSVMAALPARQAAPAGTPASE